MSIRLPRLWFSLAFATTLASCAAPSNTRDTAGSGGTAGVSGMPMGRLGHPIGTYLTITGVRAEWREEAKVGTGTLIVDAVDGRKLDAPTRVWIRNVRPLPARTRCTFSGYESGEWIGVPPEVLEATGARGPQAAWQFGRYFIVVSVEEPASLRAEFSAPLGETDR
jgi:hypothetical protein